MQQSLHNQTGSIAHFPSTLEELEKTIKRDLDITNYPSRPWVIPRQHNNEKVLDVAILGGGQAGLTIAFGLLRRQISNIMIFDRSKPGLEGPWVTFARMITLRTPKHVKGPDLGYPNLTPQAWYEAKYGVQAWQNLDKIPKEIWQEYLQWYRKVLGLPVCNYHDCTKIEWENGLLKLHFAVFDPVSQKASSKTVYARKLVLATGIDGNGTWFTPDMIRQSLPKERYAHTSEDIDFKKLSGKRIGVLGAGASAFDNAATALEQGAASVDLCIRREKIPTINPYRWMEQTGFLGFYSALDDTMKWKFMDIIISMNQPPPQDTFYRCSRFKSFSFHTGTPWESCRMDGDDIVISTPKGEMRFDFVILGTGLTINLADRKELAGFSGEIALWQDRFILPPSENADALKAFPYLGKNFQFQPRSDSSPHAAMLPHIYDFSFGTMLSMGLWGAFISGLQFGATHMANGIGEDIFREDAELYLHSLQTFDEKELVSTSAPPLGQHHHVA